MAPRKGGKSVVAARDEGDKPANQSVAKGICKLPGFQGGGEGGMAASK